MSADGRGVVGHAGARLVADVAEVTWLTGLFGDVLAVLRQRQGGHDPGRIAVDLAVMLADGGLADVDITMRIYAHTNLDAMRQTTRRLDDHLG